MNFKTFVNQKKLLSQTKSHKMKENAYISYYNVGLAYSIHKFLITQQQDK